MPRKKKPKVKNIKPIDNDNTPNAPISFNVKKMNEHEKDMHNQLKEGYSHMSKTEIRNH